MRPHILLVEDDDRQRVQLGRLLKEEGYSVEAVNNSALALGLLQSAFDLLITDVDLDCAMTGLDLVHMVRSIRPAVPIIILSAREPETSDEAVVHLRKPCPSGKLLTAIQHITSIV